MVERKQRKGCGSFDDGGLVREASREQGAAGSRGRRWEGWLRPDPGREVTHLYVGGGPGGRGLQEGQTGLVWGQGALSALVCMARGSVGQPWVAVINTSDNAPLPPMLSMGKTTGVNRAYSQREGWRKNKRVHSLRIV